MLSVVSHQIPLIRVEDDVSDSISITFEGEVIEGVTRVQAYLWNSGGREILGREVSSADPLRIDINCEQLISSPLVEQSRNSVAAITQATNTGVHIKFDLLDLQDWIKIEFLLNKQIDSVDKPKIEGVIAGIPEGIQNLHMRDMYFSRHVEYFLSGKRKSYKRELIAFSALSMISLSSLFFVNSVPGIRAEYGIALAVGFFCLAAINGWALRKTYAGKHPIQKFRSPPWIDAEVSGDEE